MATLNFPDAPDTGDIYTDSNSGFTYEWNGTVWISKDPSTASNIREIDNISSDFDGSDTTFTLKVAGVNVEPANVQQLIISVGGVMQNAGDDYTVDGSTLTFTTAPTAGLTFFGTLLGTALSLNTVADGSVSPGSLTTTSNYVMGGLTVDQSAGIITAYQFKGDGSGLTGVASTDNIVTSTDARFNANVTIGGSLTVQGTETIINVDELNVQDKTIGIGSTNAPSSTTQNLSGAIIYGQTHVNILYENDKAALGISTSVNVAGFVTATRSQIGGGVTITNTGIDAGVSSGIVTAKFFEGMGANFSNYATKAIYSGKIVGTAATIGLGVTINNTGIDAGIGAGIITAKEYYGDATNMTGAGSTFQVLSTDPYKSKEITYANFDVTDLVIGFNHGIEQGNADKEVTLRKDSATGTIVQSFGVGSSVTYSAGQAIMKPDDGVLTNEETFFVVVPAGAFKKIGTASSNAVFNGYSFTTADFKRQMFAVGQSQYGVLGNNDGSHNNRISSPTQIGSNAGFTFASTRKNWYATHILKRVSEGNYSLWNIGTFGDSGQSAMNVSGSTFGRSSPTQVGTDENWAMVSIGPGHTLGVKSDGTAWTWGYGDDGALGQDIGNARRSSPTQVGTDTTWTDNITVGEYWNVAIKTNGTLWSWGAGQSGRPLGQNQGSFLGESSPKQVGTDTTWAKLAINGSNNSIVMAIKTNGTLWSWGRNAIGNLGQNNVTQYSSPTQVGTDTTWNEVSTGFYEGNVLATKTDGTLWGWGSNSSGQCGANITTTGLSSPTQIPGTDWTTGRGDFAFTAHGQMSYATKTDGSLWAWGVGGAGQLGQGDSSGGPNRSSPIQVTGGGTNYSGGTGLGQGNDAVSYFFKKAAN